MSKFVVHISDTLDHVIASVPVFKPELALIIGFLGSIIASLFLDRYWKHSSLAITVLSLAAALLCLCAQVGNPAVAFFGMLLIDDFSVYARGIILISLLVSTLFIQQHFSQKNYSKSLGDLYSILLAAGLGLHLLTTTTHWLLAFIAIETVSISSYVLVGYFSENKKQSESAMKYVLFGSASAAVMLYGLSLFYGFTGNLDFSDPIHIQGLITAPQTMTAIAILFVFTGIGFKLGFVPFHLWTPDVYEGAPTPITTFLSTVPKIGAIVLFARIYEAWSSTLFFFSEITTVFVILIAIITMLMGNLVALRQHNTKRMMAYSSIGHTGFLLMTVIATNGQSREILLFYITAYTIMNLAAFAFIDLLEQKTGSTELSSYSGLGARYPILFTSFALVGISLVGLPPTAGFVGKLLVFTSTFELYQSTQDTAILLLLIVGALTAVISLFYYFKIPLYAFLRGAESNVKGEILSFSKLMLWIAVALSALLLVLGIFPNSLLGVFG